MIVNNFLLGIPVVAACCFLFLFFCFFNAKKASVVYIFQGIILMCLIWTGGTVLMRMQMRPGIHFWFQVSLFGLLLMPPLIYHFVFMILDIKRYSMLSLWIVLTIAGVLANAFFSIVIEDPWPVTLSNGNIGYVLPVGPGVYVLLLLECAAFLYVIYLAHQAIGKNIELRKRLLPLLFGCISILCGIIFMLVTEGVFPFDTLGGIIMACCMVYIMHKEYLIEWKYRVKIGVIYMIAFLIGFLPVGVMSNQICNEQLGLVETGQELIILVVLLMLWCVLVFWLAFRGAEHMMEKRRQDKFGKIYRFQNETASMFGEEELYDKIVATIENLPINAEVYIFARQENAEEEYQIVYQGNHAGSLTKEEISKVIARIDLPQKIGMQDISLLKYDDKIQGLLYLKMRNGERINDLEEECYQQIGAYASICLKNARIYQRVYQLSIHDELTGLYNRVYFREFVKKYWHSDCAQTFLYIDVDDFKLFNELYGEECGDAILHWCGIKIQEVIGADGAAFRFGANEFVIFSHCTDKDKLRILALQIQKRIELPGEEKPKVIQPITLSIGIACYPGTATSFEEQLKQAGKALYLAKRNGKNRVEFYESDVAELLLEETRNKAYEQIAPTVYALLAAIDAKDAYTYEHSVRVSEYAALLAAAIGLSKNEIQTVREAGLLHDIGKIGIPENILKKQGRLTLEEYEIMKKHVINSIEMIHYLPNIDYVIPAVLAHHERYDGTGYPRRLEGEGIPLFGRILAVCDSYEAITSKRSYKKALPKEQAIVELECNKGTQFDPILVDAFVKLIENGKVE